jgi:hypothetical protein
MRKYIALAAFYIGLAAIITFGVVTHAEDGPKLMDEPNPECIAFVDAAVPDLHSAYVKHIDPAILKYIILTEPGIGDTARWLLLQELLAMETAKAFGKRMSQSDAMELGTLLCRYPEPGAAPAKGRSLWAHPPEEI